MDDKAWMSAGNELKWECKQTSELLAPELTRVTLTVNYYQTTRLKPVIELLTCAMMT